jgi:hypothetical protein
MTERPILFSAPMVRAILAGQKTQTRRVVKPQPGWITLNKKGFAAGRLAEDVPSVIVWSQPESEGSPSKQIACPYGQPGDRLWVREAFSGDHSQEANPPALWSRSTPFWYWADGNPERGDWTKPRPSIHMPRWASRIALEITGVRVERLQAISEVDATAEGAKAKPFPGPWWQGYRRMDDGELMHQQSVGTEPPDWMVEPHPMGSTKHLDLSAVDGFRSLWLSINGAGSWESDPWVWVVAFKRITP